MENLIGETTEYDKKAALEVKKPKSWCKSVSAFANTLGGALIFSASLSGSVSPTICPSSAMPKISAPPSVFAKALMLLHQLLRELSVL